MNTKTKQAVEALRHGPELAVRTSAAHDADPVAREVIGDGLRRLYGFEWPKDMTLQEASTLLFKERVAFWASRG